MSSDARFAPLPILERVCVDEVPEALMLPAQWEELQQTTGVEPERKLKLAVLEDAFGVIVKLTAKATRPGTMGEAALSRLLNVFAWAEDEDGERAEKAGAPYRYSLADVAGAMRGMTAAGFRRAFLRRYRAELARAVV